MVSDNRSFPKRRKVVSEKFVFQPSTLDKLISGIWEQIHGTLNLDPRAIFEQFQTPPSAGSEALQIGLQGVAVDSLSSAAPTSNDAFSRMNVFCRKVTQASRVCRSIEIIVQARWTELFEEQVQLRIAGFPQLSATKHRKAAFMEACQDFGWSEKELRNKMAIWKGYVTPRYEASEFGRHGETFLKRSVLRRLCLSFREALFLRSCEFDAS
jgi:ATP-dependent RNA helicase DDX49/DBP8